MLRLKRLVHGEEGIALVLALMTMFVLTVVSTTVIFYTTSSGHTSKLSQTRDQAYRFAEAGINNAMAILGQPPDPVTKIGNNALDPNVFCGLAGETYTTGCTVENTYPGGYVIWSGVLNPATATWTLTSTGYAQDTVVNSASPTYSTRTLTVNVSVHPTLTQPLNTPIWNYIYATKPASTPPTCDETLANSVNVSSPFYTEGNLCLQQTAVISKGPLVVKGRLILANGNQNFVGSTTTPLSDAHILNGCTLQTTTHTPCATTNGAGVGVDNVWSTVLDTTVPQNLSPPTPNWNNWYLNGSPGPYFPCQTMNGQAPLNPLTFDNVVDPNPGDTDAQKLVYMNDSAGVQNLTPGNDYRCQTPGGELSWNNTTKTLTIKGTVYIDGSVYISNGAVNKYTGQGVIYLGGTLFIQGSSLCGAIFNGACDTRTLQTSPAQGWDPNANLICFVAAGNADNGLPAGDSIMLKGGILQGAAYAKYNIDLQTTSNVDGPMVGQQVLLAQSVSTTFPSITIVPNGMPSNPTAYAQVDPPSGYSG